ncbi:Zinc carboxypeptidase [Gracilibacillus orientalis]|uniref:Zinc carboxypeptidase n=1 Tax=Gracilibacillus orientalis TaxID=334253 RepID=A0A1I4PHY6_9BACI|nr:M14 family zinc carboxypeptidase [Gracilibacillus orientalis]SFM27210.1 Zinc carboxypeptidase [Gracilibacillus orientalis]
MNPLQYFQLKLTERKYKTLDSFIPFTLTEQVEYQPYNEVENRIQKFKCYTEIGKDASGKYGMYLVELGNKAKPKIMILSCLHGTEWQSTQFSLKFMEQLENDTFPDHKFRQYILSQFHILFIPVANPWGYNHTTPLSRYKGRKNANKVNLNRDFYDFTQEESQHIKKVIDKYKPFFYLDCHLMAPRKDGGQNYQDMIVGNVDHESDLYRDFIAKSLSVYANREVEQWNQHNNREHNGLSRRYLFNKPNPFTPNSFPFILELYRPVKNKDGIVAYLTDQEIYQFGIGAMYLFFKSAIHYYLTNNKKKIK